MKKNLKWEKLETIEDYLVRDLWRRYLQLYVPIALMFAALAAYGHVVYMLFFRDMVFPVEGTIALFVLLAAVYFAAIFRTKKLSEEFMIIADDYIRFMKKINDPKYVEWLKENYYYD